MTGTDETAETAPRSASLRDRVFEAVPLWAGALATVILYLFAVQLLGTATEAAEPIIERALRQVVVGNGSALGLSWLATYGLTNGSVVAALSLSLFRSDIVTVTEAFLLISGSRLGGAGIIVVVGFLDYLQNRGSQTVSEGTSLGLLTFLVTFSVYVPVTLLGLGVLLTARTQLFAATAGLEVNLTSLQYLEPVTDAITRILGPRIAFLVAIALLFGTLWLFDLLLERVETETVRAHVFRHFKRRWMAFGIGVVITGVTTSVAFSLGVVVPLYNRQFVRRDEMVPYILGANIGTLFDTLLVAFVLETAVGVAIVLLVIGLATLITVVLLLGYRPYSTLIDAGQDRLLEDRRFFVGFGLLLIVVPFVLLLVSHR